MFLSPQIVSRSRSIRAVAAVNTKAIDGSASGTFGGSSGTVTLTTTLANDVIIICIHNEKSGSAQTVSTVTSTHLTWARRTSQAWLNSGGDASSNNQEIWWATASSALTSEVITVTLSAATDDASMAAFGVNGCPTPSSPWDANGAVPAMAFTTTVTDSTTPLTVSGISTNSTVPMLIGFLGASEGNALGIPTGTTSIVNILNSGGVNFSHTEAFFENFSSAVSSASLSTSTNNVPRAGMIIDALA